MTPAADTRAGSIYDLGYRRYEGPRLGRAHAIRSLVVHSFRTTFGLGRGGRAKVAPIVFGALAILPAVIIVGGLTLAARFGLERAARGGRARSAIDNYFSAIARDRRPVLRGPGAGAVRARPAPRRARRCTSPGPCAGPTTPSPGSLGFMLARAPPAPAADGHPVPRPGAALDRHRRGASATNLPNVPPVARPGARDRRRSSAAWRWRSRRSRRGGRTRRPGSSPCSILPGVDRRDRDRARVEHGRDVARPASARARSSTGRTPLFFGHPLGRGVLLRRPADLGVPRQRRSSRSRIAVALILRRFARITI